MFMMAPVTQWRYKKETVLTAPVTEPSPARYIYILVKPVLIDASIVLVYVHILITLVFLPYNF